MAKKNKCDKCHAPYTYDMLTDFIHDEGMCMARQIKQANKEIDKLKGSVNFWKDAWFEVRARLGKLWWHHEAIDSDEKRGYYIENLNRLNASAKGAE